jgi:hypothetical protein
MTTAHEQQSVELTTKDVQQVLAELGDSVPAEVWRFARALKNSQLTSGKIPVISGQDTRISRGPSGRGVWTFSCAYFQSPEGRKQNSPGLQAWEPHAQRDRPERASESGRLATQRNAIYGNNAWHSATLSGRFSRGRLPRAEAHGLFCFRPSGDAKCPNSRPRAKAWAVLSSPSGGKLTACSGYWAPYTRMVLKH